MTQIDRLIESTVSFFFNLAEFFYYNGRRKPHQPVQYEHNVLLQSDVTSGTSHDTKVS